MTGISEIIFFLLFRKPLHSTSFRHSISLLNDKEWKLQWEDSIQQSFWSFPLHSLIREWCWNDRMRPNEGSFFIQGKTLKSENSLIRLHSVIPSWYSLLNRIIPFIWGSFRHSNLIPVQGLFQNHPMPTLYSIREVRMKESGAVSIRDSTWLFHSYVIPQSFWHHSMNNIELFCIWMRQEWLNDSGMIQMGSEWNNQVLSL